jgi:hypothetical protein
VTRRRPALVVLGLVVGLWSCSRSSPRAPEPAEGAGVFVLPAPHRPATVTPDVPNPPWSVSYSDGSGNGFRAEQSSAGEEPRYTYSPITPERSSTGMYSGGEPAAGALDQEQTVALWRLVRRFQRETSLHVDSRMKGTGSFRLVTPEAERAFIVSQGDELSAFDDFLARLRGIAP